MIDVVDGRAISMPLNYFPWILAATDAQRQAYDFSV